VIHVGPFLFLFFASIGELNGSSLLKCIWIWVSKIKLIHFSFVNEHQFFSRERPPPVTDPHCNVGALIKSMQNTLKKEIMRIWNQKDMTLMATLDTIWPDFVPSF
jgi:hypothetical protein